MVYFRRIDGSVEICLTVKDIPPNAVQIFHKDGQYYDSEAEAEAATVSNIIIPEVPELSEVYGVEGINEGLEVPELPQVNRTTRKRG